jgi:hypothetical protein
MATVTATAGLPMQGGMISSTLRHIGVPAAAVLMTLMAALCLAAAGAAIAVVDGTLALPLAALAALMTFQALRVPVGRAASWLIDG